MIFLYLSFCIKKKLFKAGQTVTKTSDLLHLTVVGSLHTAGHLAAQGLQQVIHDDDEEEEDDDDDGHLAAQGLQQVIHDDDDDV